MQTGRLQTQAVTYILQVMAQVGQWEQIHRCLLEMKISVVFKIYIWKEQPLSQINNTTLSHYAIYVASLRVGQSFKNRRGRKSKQKAKEKSDEVLNLVQR